MSAGGDIIGKTIAKCRILGPLGYLWVGARFVEKLFVIRPGAP